MKKLNLDYQQSPQRPSTSAGWMLLIAGLALLTEMGISYDRLQNEQESMKNEIRASKLHLDLSSKPDRPLSEKDFEEARLIMKRLSSPWDSFFTGLESVKNNNVAILSIEPDTQTGLLRVEGEAKNYPAVLTLVAQLRATKPFSEVFLQHHEIKSDDPQHPISFTMSMRWVKQS